MQRVWKKSKWSAVVAFLAASAAWTLAGRGSPDSGGVQDGKSSSSADDSLPREPTLATKQNYYFGTEICQRCHAEVPDRKQQPPLTCRCTELTLWRERDKHKEAYKALLGDRARRMGELLGVKGSIAEQKDCLACHGAYVPNDALVDASFRTEIRQEEGVSCAICHGLHKEWVDAHAPNFPEDREKWRRRRGTEKQNEFGMTDLRDPATRAALCASCHVGNHAEGKVIRHEMYAAGHPPLPGIEIATFSDEMQRHWQYIREKPDDVQKMLQELNVTPDPFEESKAMLIGGMVTFRETMKLVAAEAADCELKWPRLAQFDCYACHHELESPSWRQERGYIGKPGRLQGRSWPMVLVRLALRHLSQSDEAWSSQLKGLRGAYDAQPFGERPQIASAAGDLAEWANRQVTVLAGVKLDAAGVGKLLRFVFAMAQESAVDYDSARQIAWTFQTLYKDWAGVSRKDAANVMDELKSLNLSLFWDDGRSELDSMGEGLHKRNKYNPQPFRDEMRRLAGTLDYSLPQPDRP
jgi:hypothetical protein